MQVDYEANKKALQYFGFWYWRRSEINDSYGVGNDKFIKRILSGEGTEGRARSEISLNNYNAKRLRRAVGRP